jgi:hypothetical protein
MNQNQLIAFNCNSEEGGKWEWEFFATELLITPLGAFFETRGRRT